MLAGFNQTLLSIGFERPFALLGNVSHIQGQESEVNRGSIPQHRLVEPVESRLDHPSWWAAQCSNATLFRLTFTTATQVDPIRWSLDAPFRHHALSPGHQGCGVRSIA